MKKLYQILNINKDIYAQVNSFTIGKIGKSVIVYDKDLQEKPLVASPWKISPIFDKDINFCKLYKGDIIVDIERDMDYYTVQVLTVDWFHDYYTECYIEDHEKYDILIGIGKDLCTFKNNGGNF